MEIRETMSGFENDDNTSAALCFCDFSFRSRYSWSRSIEKIDDYLRENGKLPITLMPYENYVPWFQSKYIAFSDAALSAGILSATTKNGKRKRIRFGAPTAHLESISFIRMINCRQASR